MYACSQVIPKKLRAIVCLFKVVNKSLTTHVLHNIFVYRVMYWTDRGTNAKIEKAEMTGRKRVVIVSSGLYRPDGLTLDRKKNRLYWIDAWYRKIEYLDMNRNKRVVLLSSYNLYGAFGLTLLGDYLYWTSGWYSSSVYRADKETGSGITNFISGTGSLKGIRGYNLSQPFPTGKNKFNEQYRILHTSLNTSPNFS